MLRKLLIVSFIPALVIASFFGTTAVITMPKARGCRAEDNMKWVVNSCPHCGSQVGHWETMTQHEKEVKQMIGLPLHYDAEGDQFFVQVPGDPCATYLDFAPGPAPQASQFHDGRIIDGPPAPIAEPVRPVIQRTSQVIIGPGPSLGPPAPPPDRFDMSNGCDGIRISRQRSARIRPHDVVEELQPPTSTQSGFFNEKIIPTP